jgi:hypothetical protein
MATQDEMQTIMARAYNDTARDMERDGVTLTYAQADRIGDDGIDWLTKRLGLSCHETDGGVECEAETP